MCGRTACTLSKEHIQQACCQLDPVTKKHHELNWEDASNGGHNYNPSWNVCPTDVTPVIVSSGGKRVLKPMVWGMIPPWHKGRYNDHKLSTNNCRIEGILESKLYKHPMKEGKRCIVVCDGFYEWQTTKGKDRQPYFVFAPQPDGIQIDVSDTWSLTMSSECGWGGPRLLCMAALYDKWTSPEGDEFFSYAIVTMESDPLFSWLHHRVPAILDSETIVARWLDHGIIDPKEVLTQLKPNCSIMWHPVARTVNNSREKSSNLNKAVDLTEVKKPSKSASMMESWLRGTNESKRKSDENKEAETKKCRKSDETNN